MIETLRIDELGAQGDGIVNTPGNPLYVPFALPGELVTAGVEKHRATLLSVLEPSPQRVAPASPHFGLCGGCAIQHLAAEPYAQWKRDKVVRALRSRGIDAEVEALVRCPPASRRRITLTARAIGGRAVLGFNAAQSHDIVEIEECPVAVPQITAALGDLRALAGLVATGNKPFRITVTATETGLDLAIADLQRLDERRRQRAIEFVLARGFARLSIGGEAIVEREKPVVLFGDVPVVLPPGGFLQATMHAEKAMADLVMNWMQGARYVLDLFAGSGTFALRLARNARVHAVEGDGEALAALGQAAKKASSLKPVTSERRDLFDRPVLARELASFDGLVFDPPRAGAEAQCRQIARARIKRIAAVSCNPGTLGRDLALLVEGGYRVRRIVPIDQFLWSPHVEVVALLEWDKASAR